VARAGAAVRVPTGTQLVRSRVALQVRLGALAPGERLPDAGVIAEQLGMSEITVRRALETMCQDGLLDRRRGRTGGTFVAADWDAVAQAFHDPVKAAALADFHQLLECGLVARRAGELRPGRLAYLSTMVREMDGLDDLAALRRLEMRFHLELAEVLGDEVVSEQVADLLGRLCLLVPPPGLASIRAGNRCHAELLDALGQGLLDPAIRAVKQHQKAGS
jgi:DNA-binding FadR family transcriptional regulator